uniref:AlNc14C1G13 protein n=1 Tax=Albugo laibachii Nc14 TaxID=890382 RepID=F0VYK6_9STRA|nr:AlNc14C1G13 [Albugo laibachii Nc14]|eukprot:CCA13870.1 AlNc14C1G13 [Albugo laibachii Nc14]
MTLSLCNRCVVTIDGAVVLWSCKIQTVVSLKTMEAEIIAAQQAARELLEPRELIQELGIKIAEPMKMKNYNQVAIKQLEIEKRKSSAKHVDIRSTLSATTVTPRLCSQSS